MCAGVTMYRAKYSTSICEVSKMEWPTSAQVEEMHAEKEFDGLVSTPIFAAVKIIACNILQPVLQL